MALLKSVGLAACGVYALSSLAPIFGAFDFASAVTLPQNFLVPTTDNASTTLDPAPTPSESTFPDGVYLYGQTPEPDQLGQAYMVFEVRGGKTIGAFYMPSSSFDCFYGSIQPQELSLTIVSTYEQEAYSYALARTEYPVASVSSNPTNLNLGVEGFHQIPAITENDQRILGVCKDNYQEQVWEYPTQEI